MVMCAWQTVETESLLKPILSAEEIPGEIPGEDSFKCCTFIALCWNGVVSSSMFASFVFFLGDGKCVCMGRIRSI